MEFWPHRKFVVYGLFSLSGVCALVYEVLWSKYLSLVFGTTIWAVSVVTATFMAGLALGSYLIGRWSAGRDRNLLRLYAYLEAGIALTALAFPPTLDVVEWLYVFWNHALPDLPLVTTTCHLIFAAALLLPPAICMGGTFPVMCRLFARHKSGGQIGRLYALNTAGATLGALVAGFWLIPALGLALTGFLAAAVNVAIAAVSLQLSRQSPVARTEAVSPRREWTLRPKDHWPVLIGSALVGFVALGYEILWTRVLLLFLGNTVYAFALMLSAYLVGLALGGLLYARLVRPRMEERRLFCTMAILAGVAVLATAPFYDQLAYAFQAVHELSGERWWLLSLLSFGLVFLVLAVPTVLSGALLPAAVAILDPGQRHTGEGVGLVVMHNTVGAVLGSLVAGFILLPGVGLLSSFRLLATANILFGIAMMYRFRIGTAWTRLVPAGACAVAFALSLGFTWDEKLMNSGVYCYAAKYRAMGGLDRILAMERVVEVIEGRDTTVAVHEDPQGTMRFLTVNGKTDGGDGPDMPTQVLIGHLPLLAHPAPGEVLVIGLGTGITLSGLSAHPVRAIDCVEISPEVVRAEPYFRKSNGNPLADPKVRLTIDDGRHLLLTTNKRYDVIISEPSNPWQSGNANLFTLDFYKLAAARLADGGVFGQWIGLYDITPENLRLVLRTFLEIFPEAVAFRAGPDLILLGARSKVAFDYTEMKRRLEQPAIAAVLQPIGLSTPGELMAGYYFDEAGMLRRFAGSGPLNTDNHPHLEYSGRFNAGGKLLGKLLDANLTALQEGRGKVWLPLVNLGRQPVEVAEALRDLGMAFERNGQAAQGWVFLEKARRLIGDTTSSVPN